MTSLMFVVPVHGRVELTRLCLEMLRYQCDVLYSESGIYAGAVIVGDDESLETASTLGFGTVRRPNWFTSMKFNDGIQLACDPQYNPRPADYVVPLGSDDWIDWRLFTDPSPDAVVGFQKVSFVSEDGSEMIQRYLNYPGGCGIRIYPSYLFQPFGYRPADEDRKRGCDTSILVNLRRHYGDDLGLEHRDLDARQIVDWKSPEQQLNSSHNLQIHKVLATGDPFVELVGFYPRNALREMQRHYESRTVAV